MDLRTGIIDTAKSLGISPVDLATVISYETAGTFDPTKRGPTTQWGQHRGLIQFGEPQAREHGVDWSDPLGSQLGPGKAVASYLTSRGLKPGMGLLDLYSTINAGAPGLYNRSDANNGGAPGTVADKVRNQMAGHQQKALALLGGEFSPTFTGSSGPQVSRSNNMAQPMMGLLSGTSEPKQENLPWLQRDKTRNIFDTLAIGLEGMTMNPNQALIQAAQGRIAGRSKDKQTKEQQNKTAAWLESQGFTDLAQGVMSGAIPASAALAIVQQRQQAASAGPDQTAAMQNYQFLVAQGVEPAEAMERAFKGGVTVNTGSTGPQVGTIPQGYQMVQDETGAYRMEPIPGGPEDTSRQTQIGAENQAAGAVNVLEATQGLKEAIEKSPTATTGFAGALLSGIPGSPAYNAEATARTIKANLAFDALAAMRAASPTGGALGAVSERELSLLESQIANLDLGQGTEQVLRSIERIEDNYKRLVKRAYETGEPNKLDAIFGGRPDFVSSGSNAPKRALESISPSGLIVGQVVDGYRYKGGDPSQPSSWKKVQ